MKSLAVAAALVLMADCALAHDFWIEPSTFHPVPGAVISVSLRVGQDFIGDPVPRLSAFIAAFSVRQNGAERDVGGSDHIDPAGFLRVEGGATATISYASTGAYIELPPGAFEDYLRLYGLDDIVASRAARGESDRLGRERFYRYAKALITGRAPAVDVTRPVGLAYEIVPDNDPTSRFAAFHGRVLYEGKPLANALVVALLHGQPSVHLATHSDGNGVISLPLPCPGIWLIKSVHMLRASFFASEDWDSYWASLTFESPGPDAEPTH
ncbi:DUF4198 domain-containing protein [Bradyrhizobium sp. SZCCHNPS2010]|uniref:DUF4198 domain-containing protein n=1 Tax=Bradyrhizobium sp. SZCCHNPS2010 TaxID=3057333 RepID=UPI002915C567|nr:DUF4198 domain-containing protein [Bradyrhizobium sp. SZCCHNPS2010]